jgi:acetyl-CoA acyltransferase
MKEFGYSHEDLGAISAKAYGNANLNPKAHMHSVHMDKEIASSSGDKNPCFLENINLKPFLRLSDCSQVSDGGAALIVVSEDGLSKIGVDMNQCIEVTGFGQATGNLYTDSDPTRMPTTAAAADVAFSQAGIGRDAIDVLEIHDCFTITEMLMMEALGFVGRGEGKNLVRNGDLELGGKYPCNTGGGLVGFGHPVGATGVKQVLEIHRQMKGACGDYQLKRIPEYGITSNLGGDDKTSVVSILRNC